MILPLRDTADLGPNDGPVQMGYKIGGVGSPSPLVAGIVMGHFGLHQVHFGLQLDPVNAWTGAHLGARLHWAQPEVTS